MGTFELKDGGLLLYDDAFLPTDLADRYFVELRDHCHWEQKAGIFGHMQPRLIASYGDTGVTYRYSGMDYDIQLPKALFEDNPKSITVNWIDFYR
jgi:hypothetical protein